MHRSKHRTPAAADYAAADGRCGERCAGGKPEEGSAWLKDLAASVGVLFVVQSEFSRCVEPRPRRVGSGTLRSHFGSPRPACFIEILLRRCLIGGGMG